MGLEQDFPVRESAVPRVRVPAHRLDEWKEVAQDEITRAISHRHSWYNSFKDRVRDGFEMIADKPHLKAFVRPVPDTTDKDILIRSTLAGITLDDLVRGLYCDTTYDVRCLFAHLYEGNLLDGGILQVHEGKTDEDPMHFVGMRWIAFRSPAPAIMTSRDFLFFSYEGTAYDMDGNRVLFRFLRTMPMEDIDVEDKHLPTLVRGKISNLHLYRQNGSHVDGFTKAMHSNAGNMPSWVVTKTITFMFPGIANIETVPDARALLALGMAKLNPHRIKRKGGSRASSTQANVASLAALAAANACGVCFHKFKLTRSKRRCQSCCREVCKRCTRKIHLFDEAKQLSETSIVALRFCINCMRQARNDVRESVGYSAASHRSSFSTRRSRSSSLNSHSTNGGGSISQQHQQLQLHQQQQLQPQHQYNHRQLAMLEYHTTASQGMYDREDAESDDGSVSSYTQPNAVTLPMDQLLQLQQLQQQHQLSQQDHEHFLRLYGQYAAAAKQSNKLVSIDQLSRAKYGPAPPPPPQAAPPQSHLYTAPPAQVHPNAGTFRRHNSGGGVGWSHAAGQRAPPPPPPTSQRHYDPTPRHMIPPSPQPDHHHHVSGSSDMIPLSAAARLQSSPALFEHQHHRAPLQQRSATTASSTSSTGSHDTAASEDLEAIFRMRMLLFDDAGKQPQESDTLSTASSNRSNSSHSRRMVAGGAELHHNHNHHLPSPAPLVQRY